MARPFPVEPPFNRGAVQVNGVMTTALHAFGFDLGDSLDACMRDREGAGWLEALVARRLAETGLPRYRGRVNLRDPSFTLTEILDDSSSPLRECLPRGQRFYDQLVRVRNIRNKWQHFNHLPDIGVLTRDLGAVRDVAASADLQRLVAELDTVVRALPGVPRAGAGYGAELEERVRREREEAEEQARRAARLRRELEELRGRLAAASQHGRQIAELEAQLTQLLERLSSAEAERELAQRQFEKAKEEMARRQADELADRPEYSALAAGDPWPGAPGERVVRLMAHVHDMYDPAARRLLSEEFGPIAVEAADRWLKEMPNGGTLHLTSDGHACRVKDGSWLYLGRLAPVRRASDTSQEPKMKSVSDEEDS